MCIHENCSSTKIVARKMCSKHYTEFYRNPESEITRYRQEPKVCFVRGCSNPGAIQGNNPGMCKGHTEQQRRGNPLRTLRSSDTDELGLKQCHGCLEWYEDPENLLTSCGRCKKETYLKKTFNLSMERYEEMLQEQDGACFICKEVTDLVVDHDHRCCPAEPRSRSCGECVRRLLCTRCNIAVGFFERSPHLINHWRAYSETA